MGTLYIPGNGLMHRLDPRTKIIFLLFVIIAVFLFYDPTMQLIILAGLVLLALISRLQQALISAAKFMLLFAIFILTVHGLFNATGKTVILQLGPLAFKQESLLYGAVMACRLMVIGIVAALFVVSTKPSDLSTALIKSGFPSVIAFMLLATLQIIPLMLKEAQNVMEAQQARCVDVTSSLINRIKALIPVFVPLFIITFIKMRDLSYVLECRGFSVKGKRTYLYEVAFKVLDWVTLLILGILLGGLVILRIVIGNVAFMPTAGMLINILYGSWIVTALLFGTSWLAKLVTKGGGSLAGQSN
ncbi:Energy-coupling factor transporter transmembrane protein EcfT [Neomoorella glycerini]|uniref:Energy-coupling factor transporter transmembrane protein EcfT n=2 Tax=Neomoorella glycerini TaxID=55779 RepID=A0A6I5ZUM1_9FIRM|nr:Energy-coupling factor transporter transmembrane protein EcfT [Moorella glycerini]